MGCLELNAALACSTVTEPIRQESRRLAGDFPPSCACRTTVLAQILTTQRPNRPSLAALAGLARCKPWSWRGGVGEAGDDLGEARTLALPESSRTNADDRLSLDPLGRVEGGDGIVEGSHVADVCSHSSVTSPPDNLTQLGAIGYDDEVNRPAVSGPRLGRAGDSHQRSSASNHARRPLRDVAA